MKANLMKVAIVAVLGIGAMASAAEVCTVEIRGNEVRIECTDPKANVTVPQVGSNIRETLKAFINKGWELQQLGTWSLFVRKS
jgi:hypothetical protein